MAGRKVDWSVLRGTVVGFALCVVTAAAMLIASVYFKERMEGEYRRNHSIFRDASRQYLAVDEEERIIDEFYPQFVRLHRDGLLGTERRLSWLETLRRASEAMHIPELNYKVDAQHETRPGFDVDVGGYGLYASPMNLTLGLLHEGDLLQLLHTLDREALGQYTVRSCDLQMLDSDFTLDPTRANIRANCTLDWLTVDLRGDAELLL